MADILRLSKGDTRQSYKCFLQVALLLCLTLAGVNASPISAAQPVSAICDAAASHAAASSGVPREVLMAITRTETGRGRGGAVEPWPWTVNMEGTGKWFESEDEARAYVFRHFKRGARSFDVGCFQINYRWHGKAFRSIDDMFDPVQNALYAAGFLRQLYDEFGDWTEAAGAYHSRTPEYANLYKTRFASMRDALPDRALAAQPLRAQTPAAERINAFPLLRANGGQGGLGSLVALPTENGRALISGAARALGTRP